jgi:hypothetical protein
MRKRLIGFIVAVISAALAIGPTAISAQADTLPDPYTQIVNQQFPIQSDGQPTYMSLGLGRYYTGPNGLEIRFTNRGTGVVVTAILGLYGAPAEEALTGAVSQAASLVGASMSPTKLIGVAGAAGYAVDNINNLVQSLALDNKCLGVTVPPNGIATMLSQANLLNLARTTSPWQQPSRYDQISIWLEPCGSNGSLGDSWVPVSFPGVNGVLSAQPLTAPVIPPRIGAVDTNHAFSVKEGAVTANWTAETSADQIQLSPTRIAVLQGGVLSVKEGGVGAPWVQETTGVSAFRVTDNRIAVLQGGVLSVKEGALNAPWTQLTSGVSSFDMSPNRIAVIQGGTVSVKDGAITNTWTQVTGGVSVVKVTDNRIGVLQGDTLSVKEGSVGAAWTQLTSGVSIFDMSPNRVGVVQGGTLSVKEGALTSAWTQVTGGVSALRLTDNRIGVLQGGTFSVKDGAISATWTQVSGGTTAIDLS